jgi:hypothetical protein
MRQGSCVCVYDGEHRPFRSYTLHLSLGLSPVGADGGRLSIPPCPRARVNVGEPVLRGGVPGLSEGSARLLPAQGVEEDTCMSYAEKDTCMSYEEDTCRSYEEEREIEKFIDNQEVTEGR